MSAQQPDNAVVRPSGLPKGMISAGVLLAVVGGILLAVARSAKVKAEDLRIFNDYQYASSMSSASAQGHVGLGLLIFGAALALAGMTALAVRK